jgi:hypothetical protein
MANLIFSILSEYNSKGLNKAKKDVSAFEKNLKSLAKTLGVAFSAAAIVNFSKKAVAAFAADEKAAKALEIQLKNTGYAFSSPDVEYYIANLQKMTGVLDDQLRPAFQTLLTASGSLIQSQKALAVALDVSAATGKSVEEVSMALAKGYSGQTTALTRLGAGLDAATLKTGDMDLILTELGNKFSGQSQARLETYAGKMDVLKVSAANASETIGKGLIDALSQIGKDKNIGTLGTSLEKVASTIADVIVGMGTIIGKIIAMGKAIVEKLHLDTIIKFLYNTSLIKQLANLGASQSAPTSNFTYSLGSSAGVDIARAQEAKLRKQLNAQLAKEIELKKLRDKYDIERIGLMSALNQATDEETRLRLAEKLAILDGNTSMVDDYLALSESVKELESSTYVATEAFNSLAKATQNLILSFGVSPSQVGAGGSIIASSPASVGPSISNAGGIASVAINQGMLGTSKEAIDLSISLGFTNTSNITDALTRAVAESLMINNKNGLPTTPAGFL